MKNIIVFSLFLAVLGLYGCSEKTEEKIKEKGEDLKETAKDIYKDLKTDDSTKEKDTDSAGGVKGSDQKGAKYVCMISGAKDSKVKGTLYLYKDGDDVKIEGEITGLTEGRHGFHIHEKGVCDAPDYKSAGDHFNPTGKEHGDMSKNSHLGDLGNLKADKDGVAKVDIKLDADTWMLEGSNSIVGKSMVVHEKEDDFKTQPSGDSGNRIACGVIKASR